jgi:hypothetical protein
MRPRGVGFSAATANEGFVAFRMLRQGLRERSNLPGIRGTSTHRHAWHIKVGAFKSTVDFVRPVEADSASLIVLIAC